jgi:2-keto-4-pentenoate hydratase/2-oxohepta-3-ene-1,7-dioic acid hydratase in catechol pathway
MKIGNVHGRLVVVADGAAVDVETASAGHFAASPQAIYARWSEFLDWSADQPWRTTPSADWTPVDEVVFDAPVPEPRQVFAIGLNYADHAAEGGLDPGENPMVFTKFPSSITGPSGDIPLPAGAVDYEAELVVVIGRHAERLTADNAWDHVAGLTVGQDLSERLLQTAPPMPPQFSLGKSYPMFGPIGPVVVTPDEFDNRSDLQITCSLNGEERQCARTSQMIFSVPDILCYLTTVLPLLPGDLIFTGTPSGIGFVRQPQALIQPGDELVTTIEDIGAMRHRFFKASGV